MSEINFNDHQIPTEVLDFAKEYLSDSKSLKAQTSGSTGSPKEILLQKAHMRASALKTLEFLKIQKGGRALLCLSTEHIGGKMMVVRALEGGLELKVVTPTSRPMAGLQGEFDLVAMVALQVQESFKDLGRIKNLLIGGGPISGSLEAQLRKLPNRIFHTYGMTETISHVALRRLNGTASDNAYRALPGISFTQDKRQCLVIDAPDIGISSLVTNDVVQLLNSKAFRWLGRADNVINSGGLKIHPELLEKKLGDLGFEYILGGKPDERLGQKLIMLSSATLSETRLEDLRNRLAKLPPYHRPKELIIGEILKTSNGKIRRQISLKDLMGAADAKIISL